MFKYEQGREIGRALTHLAAHFVVERKPIHVAFGGSFDELFQIRMDREWTVAVNADDWGTLVNRRSSRVTLARDRSLSCPDAYLLLPVCPPPLPFSRSCPHLCLQNRITSLKHVGSPLFSISSLF